MFQNEKPQFNPHPECFIGHCTSCNAPLYVGYNIHYYTGETCGDCDDRQDEEARRWVLKMMPLLLLAIVVLGSLVVLGKVLLWIEGQVIRSCPDGEDHVSE